MADTILAFIIGLVLGGMLGILVISIMIVAGDDDHRGGRL